MPQQRRRVAAEDCLIALLTAGIFLLDWLTPGELCGLVALRHPGSPDRRDGATQVPRMGSRLVGALLTVVSFFLSPTGRDVPSAIFNGLLSIGVLWMVAFLVVRWRTREEEALRESEQRWATTLASIGDAVIATDVQGRVTFMNATASGTRAGRYRRRRAGR